MFLLSIKTMAAFVALLLLASTVMPVQAQPFTTETAGNATMTVMTAVPDAAIATTTAAPTVVYNMGDDVSAVGYIMDSFCLEQGFLLDRPSIDPLENPELHSFHCLIDAPPCIESPFFVLVENSGVAATPYRHGFMVASSSKEELVAYAKTVGSGCDNCTGNTELGFHLEFEGTVVGMEVVQVQLASPSPFTSLTVENQSVPVLELSYFRVPGSGTIVPHWNVSLPVQEELDPNSFFASTGVNPSAEAATAAEMQVLLVPPTETNPEGCPEQYDAAIGLVSPSESECLRLRWLYTTNDGDDDDRTIVGSWSDMPMGCFVAENVVRYNRAAHVVSNNLFVEDYSFVCLEPKTPPAVAYRWDEGIPPQMVWTNQAEPLEFLIENAAENLILQTLSDQGFNEDNAGVSYENGRFQYTPQGTDKFPFEVVLKDPNNPDVAMSFRTTVMPALPPEVEVFDSVLDLSPLSGRAEITRQVSPVNVTFNAVPNVATMDYQVVSTSDTLVIGAGEDIYKTLHDRTDVTSVVIAAETVLLQDPFWLPGANVTIYARNLVLTNNNAQINTTPRRNEFIPDEIGADGEPGQRGGDIMLNVDSVSFPFEGLVGPAFVTKGARGQEQGAGEDGRLGVSVSANCGTYGGKTIIYRKTNIDYDTCRAGSVDICPGSKEQKWPTDGEPAKAAGIPGSGGDGGQFKCTAVLPSLDIIVDTSGGLSGEDPSKEYYYKGGKAGLPTAAVMTQRQKWYAFDGGGGAFVAGLTFCAAPIYKAPVYRREKSISFGGKTQVYTKDGADAFSTVGFQTPGLTGTIEAAVAQSDIDLKSHWMYADFMANVLAQIKRTYQRGDYETARALLVKYLGEMDSAVQLQETRGRALAEVDEETYDLESIRNEMNALNSRLDMNLDFYENPAGWVPMLSYEIIEQTVDDEIEHSVELLYLVYWLSKEVRSQAASQEAMGRIANNLQSTNDMLTLQYTKLKDGLPSLQNKISESLEDKRQLEQELATLEEELRQEALATVEERNKETFWKTAVKAFTPLLSVIPVGQPALSAVGSLVDVAVDTDWENPDPFEIFQDVADVAEDYDAAIAEKEIDDQQTLTEDEKTTKKIQQAADVAGAVGEAVGGLGEAIESFQISEDEVNAELAKLKADSPRFAELSDKIRALTETRGQLASEMNAVTSALVRIPSTVFDNSLAINHVRASTTFTVQEDKRLLMYLKKMKISAMERLQKYHYYFAKAYEYRLLKPYTSSFDETEIDTMIQAADRDESKVRRLQETNGADETISAAKFESLKTAFREKLRKIAEDIFDTYIREGNSEKSTQAVFDLPPDMLADLNEGKDVVFNPVSMGLFRLDESNLRITDLVVDDIAFEGDTTQAAGSLEFNFEHGGRSLIRNEGRMYMFYHAAPFVWQTKFHLRSQETQPVPVSASEQSLLRSLLSGSTNSELLLFSRPAAWADITLSVKKPQGLDSLPKIQRLGIILSYDRNTAKSTDPNMLEVRTMLVGEDGMLRDTNLLPFFELDQMDLNGRADGRGHFYRSYKENMDLSMRVQNWIGETYVFDHWRDGSGPLDTANPSPTTTLYLSSPTTMIAVFRDKALPPGGQADGIAAVVPDPTIITEAGEQARAVDSGASTATAGWAMSIVVSSLASIVWMEFLW